MSDSLELLRLPMIAATDVQVHDKCARCGGRCCSYFALQIDSPTTWEDFDDIRWYVSHQGVSVFKEGRRWFLQVETRCDHLSPVGLCGIYERRPKICRDHRLDDCEFENPDPFDYAVHFQGSADVDAHMQKRWPRGPRRKRASRAKRALPKALRRP